MSVKASALVAALLFTAAPTIASAQQRPAAPATVPVSKEARPALAALQKAANENRMADIPALAQAALAAAKTPTDRYFAYQLQLKPAIAANNNDMTLAAIEGMIATGVPKGPELGNLAFNAAKLNYAKGPEDAAASAKAATFIDQAIAADANNADYHLILGEIRNRQKRPAEAVAALQRAMTLQQAAGKPIDQKVADRALAFAYNARLPIARQLSFDQLKRSPSPKNWRTALKIYEQTSGLSAADKVDLFRLQRLTKSFEGEGDYYPYVDALLLRGLPGEAKAVIDEGVTAGALNRSSKTWADLSSSAASRIASDRAGLAASERTALASSNPRIMLNTGDALLGYGEYARAAALYRAALGKSGVDADLANLRLGIALTNSGDKAGANAAFSAVKGARASLAQMWLLYLQTQAA